MRFVIGCVDDHHAIGLQPVTKGERRVVQILRCHLHVFDFKAALDQIVVMHARTELLQRHREVGVLHLSSQGLAQRRTNAAWPVDVPLVSGDP